MVDKLLLSVSKLFGVLIAGVQNILKVLCG